MSDEHTHIAFIPRLPVRRKFIFGWMLNAHSTVSSNAARYLRNYDVDADTFSSYRMFSSCSLHKYHKPITKFSSEPKPWMKRAHQSTCVCDNARARTSHGTQSDRLHINIHTWIIKFLKLLEQTVQRAEIMYKLFHTMRKEIKLSRKCNRIMCKIV